MESFVIRVLEYCGGGSTPFDGEYVVEYDPGRERRLPDGSLLPFYLVTSSDIRQAKRYQSDEEAAIAAH